MAPAPVTLARALRSLRPKVGGFRRTIEELVAVGRHDQWKVWMDLVGEDYQAHGAKVPQPAMGVLSHHLYGTARRIFALNHAGTP